MTRGDSGPSGGPRRDDADGVPVGSRVAPEGGPATAERLAATVQRAVPIVRRLRGMLARLAAVASVAAGVVWFGLAEPHAAGPNRTVELLVWGLVLAAAPAALWVIVGLLGSAISLPERIRSLPGRLRAAGDEIARRADEARISLGRGMARSILAAWRLWRTITGARELAAVVGPAGLLVTPWVLGAMVVAVPVAMMEVVAAIIVVVARLFG